MKLEMDHFYFLTISHRNISEKMIKFALSTNKNFINLKEGGNMFNKKLKKHVLLLISFVNISNYDKIC